MENSKLFTLKLNPWEVQRLEELSVSYGMAKAAILKQPLYSSESLILRNIIPSLHLLDNALSHRDINAARKEIMNLCLLLNSSKMMTH